MAIVEVLFLNAGTGQNGVLTVAEFFGLHAAVLMLFQLLPARLPWLDRRIGMNRLTVWHRWVGFTLLWTILTHAVQAVGSAGAGLRHIPVGSRAFVEGPYGAFTSLHRTRPGALLIAGGLGITPVRDLLEEEPAGDVVVLYRVRSEHDAVLVDEVRALVADRGGELHLQTRRTGEGSTQFEPDILRALVPDMAERDVYVCGPPAMTSAVLSALRGLKVPHRQVHAERFALA
ncbi:Oxidoreductase NAD-binding domain-containing protein [Streptomyces sp. cf386]|nr:Oxidoreductase NAD-binding domain-containing protein [Streptomyces sp. cf386]